MGKIKQGETYLLSLCKGRVEKGLCCIAKRSGVSRRYKMKEVGERHESSALHETRRIGEGENISPRFLLINLYRLPFTIPAIFSYNLIQSFHSNIPFILSSILSTFSRQISSFIISLIHSYPPTTHTFFLAAIYSRSYLPLPPFPQS